MRFKTKRELLKHLGKYEKDNKWVDRALARGTVVHKTVGYSLTSEYLEELENIVRLVNTEPVEEVEEKKKEKSESSD